MEEIFRNFIRTNHLTDKWEEFIKDNNLESNEDLKRVYVTQDDDGHNYVIPYELKGEFQIALNSTLNRHF